MYSIITIHTQGNNKLKRKHSNIYLYIHTSIRTGEQINFKTMAHFNNVRIEVKKNNNQITKQKCAASIAVFLENFYENWWLIDFTNLLVL